MATNIAIKDGWKKKLPFIISRSSFVGLGAYASKWFLYYIIKIFKFLIYSELEIIILNGLI